MVDDQTLTELLGGLRVLAMLRVYFRPVAHLPFDQLGVYSLSPRRQNLFAHFCQQLSVPTPHPLRTPGTFGQQATQYLQRPHERQPPQCHLHLFGRLGNQAPHHVVPQQQSVNLLHHPRWCFAAQHRPLTRLEFNAMKGKHTPKEESFGKGYNLYKNFSRAGAMLIARLNATAAIASSTSISFASIR